MTNATVEISESNGAGETVTDGVSNINFGDTDAANLDPTQYPISPGNNSYEKWERLHVSANPDGNTIDNIRVYISSGTNPQNNATLKTNCTTSGYSQASYSTPVKTTSTVATNDMPTSEPGSANLGIGGSLSGSITSTGYSDYCVMQCQVGSGATQGGSWTITFAYDETA